MDNLYLEIYPYPPHDFGLFVQSDELKDRKSIYINLNVSVNIAAINIILKKSKSQPKEDD